MKNFFTVYFLPFFFSALKIFGILFGLLLFNIIILKWFPVSFTPTMFFRSMEAWSEGKNTRIYYTWKKYDDIANDVKLAVIASEDQRFRTHGGIDYQAIEVAITENKNSTHKRGASTISQQVAKNVFLWQGGGYFRKALEVPITYLIEWIWGKKRILEVYLNIAEMAPQTFGVGALSKKYFKKDAKNLNVYESALIAAVLPNPRYWLVNNPNQTVNFRKNHTLYQMQLFGGVGFLNGL